MKFQNDRLGQLMHRRLCRYIAGVHRNTRIEEVTAKGS